MRRGNNPAVQSYRVKGLNGTIHCQCRRGRHTFAAMRVSPVPTVPRSLDRRAEALAAKTERAVATQGRRGRGSARQRLAQLLDAGSFLELDAFAGGGGGAGGSGGGGDGGDAGFWEAPGFR